MWVHTMGCIDQLQKAWSQNGLVFGKQNKDVVLQPIEIMGTIEISDQSTTPANLVDLIDEIFAGIMNIAMEFPTL